MMKAESKIYLVGLTIVILLGTALRIYNLNSNPPGFFCDEASIGYNAYSLLTTGKDEHGQDWPIFFRSFGDYKLPLAIYSTIPLVAAFGLNEVSVRLTSTIYSVATILLVYLLATTLAKSYQVGLLSTLFLSISPWHIHLGRTAFECSLFLFFLCAGCYFLIKAVTKPSNLLPLSFILFALSLYTYQPSKVFVPLFFLLILFIYRSQIKTHRALLVSSCLFLVLIAPLTAHMLSPQGWARARQVSVFRFEKGISSLVSHIVNKYLLAFSPQFLFQLGDAGMPGQAVLRHSVPGIGELFWFQLPLVVSGLVFLTKYRRRQASKVILGWLLLYPLADSLTIGPPQATHLITGVIPFQIVIAFGLNYLLKAIKRIRAHTTIRAATLLLITTFLSFLALFETSRYLNALFLKYPQEAAGFYGWQYGPREIIAHFLENQQNYDQLIMDYRFNAPTIFFKFYAPQSCHNCLTGPIERMFNPDKKQLFAYRPEVFDEKGRFFQTKRVKINKIIYYPSGEVAFKIFELFPVTD